MKRILFVMAISSFFMPSADASAEETKHLFILSGQSNMRQPLPDSFKKCVSEVFGEEKVTVVTVARPSQPIKQWHKNWAPPEGMEDPKPESNGNLYDKLIQSVRKEIKESKPASVTYVWMQGEADAKSGWGAVYEKSFLAVLDQLKSDLGVENIHFVLGRINDYWLTERGFKDGDLIRSIQMKLGDNRANGAWVNTDDVNFGVNPWGGFSFDDGHFPPQGYRVMGQRFAWEACQLIDPELEKDDAVFKEVYLDEVSKVKSHMAIGKSVRGMTKNLKYSAGKGALTSLVDGAFASAAATGPEWVDFTPPEAGAAFIIDLGEEIEIGSVGINVLVSREAKAFFPKSIAIDYSTDGERYEKLHSRALPIKIGKPAYQTALRDEFEPRRCLMLVEASRTKGRFVKVTFMPDSNPENRVYIDEIMVNPVAK